MTEMTLSVKNILESAEDGTSLDAVMDSMDAGGNKEISKDEWMTYLAEKKERMGEDVFHIFLNYIEISAQEQHRNYSKPIDQGPQPWAMQR